MVVRSFMHSYDGLGNSVSKNRTEDASCAAVESLQPKHYENQRQSVGSGWRIATTLRYVPIHESLVEFR